MILFNLSRELSKALFKHMTKPAGDPDLVWRAHAAQIGGDTCIVAQEQYSQYIMVFCGVTAKDFANFPAYFLDRFWREASAICRQSPLFDVATINEHLMALGQSQAYRQDPEPLEEGKLIKVMEKLERLFLYDRKPLPYTGKEAFEFGFAINSRRPKADMDAGKPTAAEALGDICLNLIELRILEQREKVLESVISEQDNIINVDFARNRR